MTIQKVKDFSGIDIQQIKTHLKIFSGDTTYDSELQQLIEVACSDVEAFTQLDIFPTNNLLEDYNLSGRDYQINEGSIRLSGVTAYTFTDNFEIESITTFPPSSCTTYNFNQYSIVRLPYSINCDQLNIEYGSGKNTVDPQILHAVKLRVGYYFDGDRNETSTSNIKETRAFTRLLSTYMNLIN